MSIVDTTPATPGLAAARRTMIDSQLRPSGVNDRAVLERMAQVAREDFVPAEARAIVYADRALPLGNGRFLAAPLFHGLMLQEAAPLPTDTALVVDGGSGYFAELLRPLVASLEVLSPAAAAAGEGARGPYSLICIDGAVEQVGAALAALLAPEGRLVAGLVDHGVTRLAAGRRAGEAVALLPLVDVGVPVLSEFAKPKAWTF